MNQQILKARSIAERFDTEGEIVTVMPYGNGHINDTYRVETSTGMDYILQRLNPAAFAHPERVMDNIVLVTGFLRQKIVLRGGNPLRETLTPVALPDGRWWIADEEGGAWRMYICINGTVSYDLAEDTAVLREAGRAFGAFMTDLADCPAERLHETIPHFHDTPERIASFRRSAAKDSAGRAAAAQKEIAFVEARAGRANELTGQLDAGILPLRVTHNDTKLNNVLFDPVTGRAQCVVDLDTVMPGLIAYDFGDAVRFGASTAAEDEADPARIRFDGDKYRAWTEGYLEAAGTALTEAELLSLPVGAWMMTFEVGLRFLTDYLDGDVYFHTAYPEHNLVRARNQFTLLADMERHQAMMLKTVQAWKKEDNHG